MSRIARTVYSERFSRYGVSVEEARITREKLLTLRTKQMQENRPRKTVVLVVREIQSFLSGLLHCLPSDPHTMCKYYGHVQGDWHGPLPTCADCGATIHSLEELRSASPRA